MSTYVFLFDLDSTITKEEILPKIAEAINKKDEMRELTEKAMVGDIPFKNSFLKRVEVLKEISIEEAKKIVASVELNSEIVKFIKKNKKRCYVVTGNLDVWIELLMKKIGVDKSHIYCSKAETENGYLKQVISVADKELITKQFVQPIVSVGDGDNDSGMAKNSEIAIGYGGVRRIANSLIQNIDFAFYDEKKCAKFLEKLL